jgi:hypothetical protein
MPPDVFKPFTSFPSDRVDTDPKGEAIMSLILKLVDLRSIVTDPLAQMSLDEDYADFPDVVDDYSNQVNVLRSYSDFELLPRLSALVTRVCYILHSW